MLNSHRIICGSSAWSNFSSFPESICFIQMLLGDCRSTKTAVYEENALSTTAPWTWKHLFLYASTGVKRVVRLLGYACHHQACCGLNLHSLGAISLLKCLKVILVSELTFKYVTTPLRTNPLFECFQSIALECLALSVREQKRAHLSTKNT